MQNNFSNGVKMLNNKVLVEIVSKYDDEVKLGDHKIKVNTSYNPEQFLTTIGIVRGLPERLTMGCGPDDMEWKTNMQLKLNDRVIMSYMGVASTMGQNKKVIEVNGKTCIIVHYRNLIMAIRGTEEIMLNGFNLVEPMYEVDVPGVTKHLLSVVPDTVAKKYSKQYGKVKLCGEPNSEYVSENALDTTVKVGDIIMYHKAAGIPFYRSSDDLVRGKNVFLKIQSRYMLAIIES